MGTVPRQIKLTKDGGNWWRGWIFHYAFTIPVFLFATVAIIIAVINPFWFRESFFRWVEVTIHKISSWRNYKHYAIYLGTDPKMWHMLKDSHDSDVGVEQSP